MNRALRIHGAPTMVGTEGGLCPVAVDSRVKGWQSSSEGRHGRRAFTLLEMCIVMFIMAVLAAVSMPAFQSAVNEHKIRENSQQLAVMVRAAMVQCNEQHGNYVIDLTKNSMSLHPQYQASTDDNGNEEATLFRDSGSTTPADHAPAGNAAQDADDTHSLNDGNKFQQADPIKTDTWITVPDEGLQWIFQPGELCPAAKVRIARGDAYVEMDFQALTGDVESEKSYFP